MTYWLGYFALVAIVLYLLEIRRRSKRPGPPPPDLLSPEELARLRDRIIALASPALRLRPTETRGFSKLGGEPDLPFGIDWPMGGEGPRAFLAQLDLSAVRAGGGPDWLQDRGVIYAFLDDTRWGLPDPVLVLFSPDGGRTPATPPAGLHRKHRYAERRVGFHPFTSIPSPDWMDVDYRTMPGSTRALDELLDLLGQVPVEPPLHQIGGYPNEIQGEQMALSCEFAVRGLTRDYSQPVPADIQAAAEAWRLLLQIDSDPQLKMNWGDGGMIYVFIREADARMGDFSRTATIWQSY